MPLVCTFERRSIAGFLVQLLVACISLALGSVSLASSQQRVKDGVQDKAQPASKSVARTVDPETMLIEIYKELASNRLRHAQEKADKLVEAYPNFQLGHLVRGDLLLMHARPVNAFGAVPNGPPDKLKNLRDEAIARIRFLQEKPDPRLVPRAVLQMRQDQKHILIVDAKRSRLYVYANQEQQLKFVTDYYISQGKFGVGKFKEGDQRTPLGVYYITARLPGAKLPDFYGPGALPINYPNEWDKVNGRGGSGIWLHGTPSANYSRPPLSSDGCVVLTNPDMMKLSASVEIGKTPVIISEHVEFVSPSKLAAEREESNKLLEAWRQDMESLNSERLLANYSARFKTEQGENLQTWFSKQRKPVSGANRASISLRDVTFFRYPGRNEMIVGTFTEDAQFGKSKHSVRKRQYWAKEGRQWKIVAETAW